ncbi:GntR family transcriptional regulator [Amylibacter ulvae]|uniref:GntR family transcriptional regulator n=2 Tax=Paramylibacter ulvae TaxID=1651968 RepID=A0ABQ3CY13_9RHOB|nr:GntR family transcriptional regulator [Amylibacter ulvae]
MGGRTKQSDKVLPLSPIQQSPIPTVADQVFDELQKRILTLELPPNTKISETEVATKMGVSRQPVREAFKRLSKLGFLDIRPQSGTKVSLISESAVLRARFIRIALEIQTCQTACNTVTSENIKSLRSLINAQREAVESNNRVLFHALDDKFHQEICIVAGVGYVWDIIRDNKAHMDRIRMLSLDQTSQRLALDEHIQMIDAIEAQNEDAASQAISKHLNRIFILIKEIKSGNHNWFTDNAI